MRITPLAFFEQGSVSLRIDIRPADAFKKGHLPWSVNFPCDPEAEAEVQPLKAYLHQVVVKDQIHLVDQNGLYTHLNALPPKVHVLEGGYKGYRNWMNHAFIADRKVLVLGGKTGSRKTEMLHRLELEGEQHLALEALAQHKGSVFGNLHQHQQPTHNLFQNKVLKYWKKCSPALPVWIEEEGKFIGRVGLPVSLYHRMQEAPMIELVIPFHERLNHIYMHYAHINDALFRQAIVKLAPRMGKFLSQKALEHHQNDQIKKSIALLLNYYDETYRHRRSEQRSGPHICIEGSHRYPKALLQKILQQKNKWL